MWRTAAATYTVVATTKMAMAAATDHQTRAAMTGSPTSTQAPTARMSIPRAFRSANQSASRSMCNSVPGESSAGSVVAGLGKVVVLALSGTAIAAACGGLHVASQGIPSRSWLLHGMAIVLAVASYALALGIAENA